MSLEMARKVTIPQKNYCMSRSFLNSGTLLVITCTFYVISKKENERHTSGGFIYDKTKVQCLRVRQVQLRERK